MNLEDLLRSRIHRILLPMASFQPISNVDSPSYDHLQSLRQGEILLGIYYNAPAELEGAVWITTRGLYVLRGDQREVADYSEMIDVRVPDMPRDQKLSVDTLLVSTRTAEITVPIKGGEGRFRDVWQFLRFLLRVRDDFQEQQPKPE